MNYWLLKTEASCYGILDLQKEKKTSWTGIRNYQARNFIRDDMHIGDLALIYHSNGTKENPTGVYGLGKIVTEAYPDKTQFDKKDTHYDRKASNKNPLWFCVDIAYVKKYLHPVPLSEIKIDPELEGIMVAQTGNRLSVQPLIKKHFLHIEKLGK